MSRVTSQAIFWQPPFPHMQIVGTLSINSSCTLEEGGGGVVSNTPGRQGEEKAGTSVCEANVLVLCWQVLGHHVPSYRPQRDDQQPEDVQGRGPFPFS
jgi:hypothetical protein